MGIGLPSTKFNAVIGSIKSISCMSSLNRFMILPLSVFWKKLKGALGVGQYMFSVANAFSTYRRTDCNRSECRASEVVPTTSTINILHQDKRIFIAREKEDLTRTRLLGRE